MNQFNTIENPEESEQHLNFDYDLPELQVEDLTTYRPGMESDDILMDEDETEPNQQMISTNEQMAEASTCFTPNLAYIQNQPKIDNGFDKLFGSFSDSNQTDTFEQL